MKKLTIEKKKKINKVILTLLVLVHFGAMVISILTREGLMSFSNGGINADGLFEFINNYSGFGILIYIALYMVIASTTSFIPMTSFAMIFLGVRLFKSKFGLLGSSAITLTAVFLTSMLLYAIGRFGGRKLGNIILGEEDIEKATELLETKGQVYLPLMLMFPMFPDDALCFASGVLKMKWWYFSIIAIIFRGIGVFTINLIGGDVGEWVIAKLGSDLILWFLFITALVFWVVVILYLANKLDKFLEKKRNKTSD